ncbi:MAG: T9SS type A sorting domain-containing protein [Lentisphaeria bacterium]|nr:T9SS type A sorting domain-containing protein [Candidatus Neomarinimicrobiota bacterium]MCF7843003.1 T9SS type A sorting domain-containing protein [Lentisphaeria bacterium]
MPFSVRDAFFKIVSSTLLLIFVQPLVVTGQGIHSVKCGFGDGNLALRPAALVNGRPVLENSYISPTGNFKIHYDTGGYHAVNTTDTLPDGTPRFVFEAAMAADSAFTMLVHHLGFNLPVHDPTDGPEYDIYIKNWGGQYYGMTYFSSTTSPAYLVIDNDYAETNYYTHGLDALRVTVAHEFFHMVQVHYSIPSPADYQYWYEMSSVWFEEYCYPEVNDYLGYVQSVFSQNPSPRLDDTYHQYGQGLFPYVLDRVYGFSSGKHIMTDLWEQLGSRDPVQNLKSILASSRWNYSSLEQALSLYGVYNTFTGERGQENGLYPDAALLPTVPYADVNLSLSGGRTDSYSVPPLSIFYNRYLVSGVGTIFLTNQTDDGVPTATQLAIGAVNGNLVSLNALTPNLVKATRVNSGTVLYLPTANASASSANPMIILIQTNALDLATSFQAIFPNPVTSDRDNILCDLTLGKAGTVTGKIYNILGQEVISREFQLVEDVHLLHLPFPHNLPAGIYFAQFRTPDGVFTKKFTYIR